MISNSSLDLNKVDENGETLLMKIIKINEEMINILGKVAKERNDVDYTLVDNNGNSLLTIIEKKGIDVKSLGNNPTNEELKTFFSDQFDQYQYFGF